VSLPGVAHASRAKSHQDMGVSLPGPARASRAKSHQDMGEPPERGLREPACHQPEGSAEPEKLREAAEPKPTAAGPAEAGPTAAGPAEAGAKEAVAARTRAAAAWRRRHVSRNSASGSGARPQPGHPVAGSAALRQYGQG
jgi:nucleoid-associated protein YgaU